MNTKTFGFATLLCAIASPLFGAPIMTVTPAGVQAGNWVWNVSITPDLSLIPDNSGTPVAVELGFRMTGGSLLNVTNVNTGEFNFSNPGMPIFGWEVPYPDANNRPEGIEANCTGCTVINPIFPPAHPATVVPGITNEIFVAIGSGNFTTAGAKPFLQITTTGPSLGSLSSTIQWLGAYNGGKGRITQVTGLNGGTYTTSNFDVFSGSLTQTVPEPACALLLGIGTIFAPLARRRR